MEKNYWMLLSLTTISSLLFAAMLILGFVFFKKILKLQYGKIIVPIWLVISVAMLTLCLPHFIRCCQDYQYVSNNSYIETEAVVIKFEKSWTDYDGNGQIVYREPLLHLPNGTSLTLPLTNNDVEIGKTYLIRYYPATKICEVVKEIKNATP